MAEFMLLLHQYPTPGSDLSPEQIQRVIGEYKDWSQKLAAAGKLKGGNKLTNEGGRSLAVTDGKLAVTDGPYSETKEAIGGFFQIEAADYDQAVSMASDCPHLKYGGRIELRQIHNV